jgi:hypothetical protein
MFTPPPPPPDGPPEILIGRIVAVFGMIRMSPLQCAQVGPARIDFTDRRVVVASTVPPVRFPTRALYESWRTALPALPVCELVGAPYSQDEGQVWWELPAAQVTQVRVGRPVGIGFLADPTMADLLISNIQTGLASFSPWKSPGVPIHSPEALDLDYRVPASPDDVRALILRTPLANLVSP